MDLRDPGGLDLGPDPHVALCPTLVPYETQKAHAHLPSQERPHLSLVVNCASQEQG